MSAKFIAPPEVGGAPAVSVRPDAPSDDVRDSIVSNRVKEAEAAYSRGWVFTPLNGKKPYLKGWTEAERPSLHQVLEWACSKNLGLRTGAVSGVVVIDDDSQDGSATLGLKLPPTVTVRTGSGKSHFYFKYPGSPTPNSARRVAACIDIRGDGGAVAFVGSIHPDTGQPYKWAEGRSPSEIELAELPEHVLVLIREKGRAKGSGKQPKSKRNKRGDAALAGVAQLVRSAPEGQRNDTLNSGAFKLGKLIGSGELDRHDVEETLRREAAHAGLESDEIESTLRSGIESGMAEARNGDARGADKEERKVEARESIGQDGRPVIFIEPGDLHLTVAEAEQVLRDAKNPLSFDFGRLLVRLSSPRTEVNGATGHRRRREIVPWELPNLIEKLTGLAHWMKWDGRRQDYVPTDCPERVAKMLLARRADRQISILRKVASTPVLRRDYSIVQTPGYDKTSELFLDIVEGEFAEIPVAPTREQGLAELAKLKFLIKDFPFVSGTDTAAALAAIVTALVRPALPTAPLFAFKAPKMGSGKSLLADVVALVATGELAPTVSGEANEEELRKRFSAILFEGAPLICIDNIDRPFFSTSLCTILTQGKWKDRVLGSTATFEAPTETLWLATGNNLTFKRDLATRVIPCRIDAETEHPEERSFEVDLREYIPAHRAELVVAGLTFLRAYIAAGMPPQEVREFGRFEKWSKLIRFALIWAGEADPCSGRRELEEADPERELVVELLAAWESVLGTDPIAAAEVLRRADAEGGERLADALRAVLAADELSKASVSLGRWLQRHAAQIEGGRYVKCARKLQGTRLWQVSHA